MRARGQNGGLPGDERWHARENRCCDIEAAHGPGRAKLPGAQHLPKTTEREPPWGKAGPRFDPRRAVCSQLPLSPTQVTPFHSSKPPTISVKSYLEDRCGAPAAPAPAPPGGVPLPRGRTVRAAERLRAGVAHAARARGAVLARRLSPAHGPCASHGFAPAAHLTACARELHVARAAAALVRCALAPPLLTRGAARAGS